MFRVRKATDCSYVTGLAQDMGTWEKSALVIAFEEQWLGYEGQACKGQVCKGQVCKGQERRDWLWDSG